MNIDDFKSSMEEYVRHSSKDIILKNFGELCLDKLISSELDDQQQDDLHALVCAIEKKFPLFDLMKETLLRNFANDIIGKRLDGLSTEQLRCIALATLPKEQDDAETIDAKV